MRRKFVLCLVGLILTSPAWCGTGSYTPGDPDLIQLNVRFQDFPQEPDLRTWVPLFSTASQLLFDATERQVKISKVVFYQRCPATAHRADVIIFNDLQEALSSPGLLGLDKPGLGEPNLGIRLSNRHRTVCERNNRGELGLVHELGHYVFGLRDEYKDKNGHRSDSAGCAFRNGIFDETASIMDSGTREVPNNARTEFCVASNHHTGRTQQDQRRNIGTRPFEDADDWHWLVAWVGEHFGATLTHPDGLPLSDRSGFGRDPEFVVEACGGLRLSLGIDSSESMRAFRAPGAAGARPSGTPIGVAKEGSRKLIQLLEEGDTAGVVAVGGDTDTDTVPMRSMSTENKLRTFSAIPEFQARGEGGWAEVLRESIRQVRGEGDAATSAGNEAVVLISDGRQDVEEIPDDLLSVARQRGVIVHTIGIGHESTELRRVAEKTGGRYRYARNATQVNADLLSVVADLKSRGILAAQEGRLRPGKTQTITVQVDQATKEQTADFLLAWSDPGTDLEMTLEGPDHQMLSADAANVVFQEHFDRKLKRYRIFHPAAGTWKISLTNPGASPRDFAFQVHTWTDDVTVTASAADDVVTPSEPLVLKAAVSTRLPVAGAKVTARIERPTGEPVTLDLFDDGSPEHQDELADDGSYSNVFEEYAGSGTYTVDVTVDSDGGYTVHPEDAEYQSQPVEDRFVRTVRFFTLVQGDSDE